MQKLIPMIATALVLSACGGGGYGTSSVANTPAATAAQPVTAMGTISAFGSVFVNGVRYDISSAMIAKDGQTVTQADLAVGQMALVRGRADSNGGNGHADSVEVEHNVIGPIKSIDAANNKIVVLGQTVIVDSNTSYSANITPNSLAGLTVGDRIEVSGTPAANGDIAASRIEKESGTALQVVGTVSNINLTVHTFSINGLVVNFTTATVDGFTAGQPANGDLVAVRGTSFDAATTTLTATRVLPAVSDARRFAGRDALEQEGVITRYVSATDFDVANKKVTTTATTVYRNGVVTDLAKDVKVEVRGKLDSANTLVADVVEFRRAGVLELAATISNVDKPGGKITVLGVEVTLNATTRLDDKTPAHIQQFSINDLNSNDMVIVRGFESPAGSGKVTATRLERIPSTTTDVFVRGPFTAATPPQFKIIGITIDTSTASFVSGEHEGGNHGTLTAADFFANAVGKVVFVRGKLSGANVMATQVAIAERDDE